MMKKHDSEKWQQMAAYFDSDPFATVLGAKVVELDDGYAKIGLTLGPEHIRLLKEQLPTHVRTSAL